MVQKILSQEIPHEEVWAFGSRLSGEARPYSDLDLVVVGQKKLEQRTLTNLKQAFQSSRLPFRVDLLDWHRIPDHFKRIIENQYEIFQTATSSPE